jgi:hypothetical protein
MEMLLRRRWQPLGRTKDYAQQLARSLSLFFSLSHHWANEQTSRGFPSTAAAATANAFLQPVDLYNIQCNIRWYANTMHCVNMFNVRKSEGGQEKKCNIRNVKKKSRTVFVYIKLLLDA